MARERSLNAEWLQFRMLDIAHNAPDVQIREMRKAFYAGAASAMAITSEADGAKISPRDRGLMYRALLDEIDRYLEDFKRSAQQHSGEQSK
jgi:hypothetical protein